MEDFMHHITFAKLVCVNACVCVLREDLQMAETNVTYGGLLNVLIAL